MSHEKVYDFTFMRYLEKSDFMEMEVELWLLWTGRNGEFFNGSEFLFCKTRLLEFGCTTV